MDEGHRGTMSEMISKDVGLDFVGEAFIGLAEETRSLPHFDIQRIVS